MVTYIDPQYNFHKKYYKSLAQVQKTLSFKNKYHD